MLALLVAMAALISVFCFLLGGGRMRWFGAWREVAPRYRAVIDSRWWRPRMRFGWRGEQATLLSMRRMNDGSMPGIVLETGAHEISQRFSVFSRNWPGISRSGEMAESGSAPKSAFDSRFVIFGSGREQTLLPADSLPGHVRWQIQELGEWSGRNCIRVELVPGRIRIWISNNLRTSAELEDFLRLGLRIVDQLRTAQTDGLDFVNENQATIMDDVFCPICTDRLEGKMVICIRCKTPHCRACWEYNGKCGMFACTESRYAPVGR